MHLHFMKAIISSVFPNIIGLGSKETLLKEATKNSTKNDSFIQTKALFH